MKRTTVYLEETTDLALKRLSNRTKRSQAELMREALETYVQQKAEEVRAPSWVGLGESNVPNLAERTDELLFADLAWPIKPE